MNLSGTNQIDFDHVVDLLSDRSRAEDPSTFPADPIAASKPGLYSWWADSTARELIGQVLSSSISEMIYIGQAGATLNGKRPKSTLASRMRPHIRATARRSTFALAISALLLEPLELRVEKPKHLVPEDRQKVAEWIKDHLRVAVAPVDDRDLLERIEDVVLERLDPPLNLKKRPRTASRQRLAQLRRQISHPSR